MPGAKKNPAAAAIAPAARPYTHRGGRRPPSKRNGGEQTAVTSAEWEAIHALDRKLTDGLNLVHEQLGVIRQERLEDRREFRQFRNEVRQEFKAVREETRQQIERLRGDTRQQVGARGGDTGQRIHGLREDIRRQFEGLREDNRQLIEGLRELSAQVGTLLERSRGTRRLVWGVLGALGLLAAGGVLRPVFDRVVAALFAG